MYRVGLISLAIVLLFVKGTVGDAQEDGEKYLEANKDKAGVVVLESGLQYKVLKEGKGKFHPTKDSPCLCHYHGTLIDGTVFDSSVDRDEPIEFAPKQVIKGWTEAMQMMVEGDKWELYIPSELAYGERGSQPLIDPGATLVFTIEMLEIRGDKVPAQRCNPFKIEEEEKGGCGEREIGYIMKRKGDGVEAWTKEITRLEAMKSGKMKPALVDWINQRLGILKKLVEGPGEGGETKEDL